MRSSPAKEAEILSAAQALSGAEARCAFLDVACGGDDAMRARLGAQLADDAPPQGNQGEPETFQIRTENLVPVTEKPGTRIGRYKLLQNIGEGGCGTVFMAEQEEPVRRRVALKIIKLGMDTRSVIARFEAERQALAMMDHPNIARVLDAGATETGRPFFVMELVRGVPITRYCDESQLDNSARLALFVQVCNAIQHAHQKGVIHRDIKPSNILVTLHDGVPVPKVIDFGIAKATTGERLTALTLFTAYEQFIGTPAYMSPEQAEMSGLDIDTRSDIYSLGVLLYELLTGRTPFDAQELAKAGLDEIRRRIREEEPVPPSTRINTLGGDDLTAVAKSHSTDAPKLASLLRGDLDWVVLKCLEKERSRRYETAASLAVDIQRHLQHEPVTARPPSAAYRLQKFYRRHRTGFISGTAAVVMLLAGLGIAAWQAVRAGRAEKSERAQAQQARSDRDRAVGAEALAKEKAEAAQAAMQRATKSELEARQNLYAADVRIAFEHLRMDNLKAARRLIEKHVPSAGAPEFRGFEWRYIWAQSEGDPHTTLINSGFGGAFWISFSPDGRLAALCGFDVKVLDMATGKEVYRFSNRPDWRARAGNGEVPRAAESARPPAGTPPPGPGRSSGRSGSGAGNAAFTPDGSTLIIASDAGVQFIDTATWQKRDTSLPGASGQVSLSADGKVMATDGEDGVGIWRLSGDQWSRTNLLPHATRPVTLSPDGLRLLSGVRSEGLMPFAGLELWNLEADPVPVMLADSAALLSHPSRMLLSTRSVAFSPDGKFIATASWTGDLPVTIWDGRTAEKLFTLTGHTGSITCVDFSPDSRVLATGSLDSTVRLWDLHTRQLIRKQRGHLEQINALRLSTDGKFLLSSSLDGAVLRWPVEPAAVPSARDPEELLCWLSPDGSEIATSSRTAGLHFWKTETGETLRRWPVAASNRGGTVKVSPDGRLAALGQADGSISILSCATGESSSLKGHPGGVDAFEFSPDGRLLVSTGRDRRLRWWDLVAREQVAETEIESRSAMVSDFAFSPDGQTLAGAGFRGLQKWSTATRAALPCEIPAWMRVSYSPDGRWLVVGSFGEEVRLVDATTGELRAGFAGHSEGVLGCAISPDSLTLASTSSDGTLRLWNVATARELALFWQKGRGFDRPMFSKDGRVLAAGSGQGMGGQVQIWRAPSWEEIDAIEKARPVPERMETPRPPR